MSARAELSDSFRCRVCLRPYKRLRNPVCNQDNKGIIKACLGYSGAYLSALKMSNYVVGPTSIWDNSPR